MTDKCLLLVLVQLFYNVTYNKTYSIFGRMRQPAGHILGHMSNIVRQLIALYEIP